MPLVGIVEDYLSTVTGLCAWVSFGGSERIFYSTWDHLQSKRKGKVTRKGTESECGIGIEEKMLRTEQRGGGI